MTVAQLIRMLKMMPQEATITMSNKNYYIDGKYTVTFVETYDGNTVEICTDYKEEIP